MINIGIDVGSTTVKVVAKEGDKIIFSDYQRHSAKVLETIQYMIDAFLAQHGDGPVTVALAGSAGLGVSERTRLPFVQEVIAAARALKETYGQVDCAIELGGEDAKIIFFGDHLEQRMNGTCAGGTGAFIDQMATLLDVSVLQLNDLAANHKQLYNIASRCGVFAKSDIQPLLNQGATKEDLAASILQAIVNQTVVGLAQGRQIKGKVAFLGGPLYFLSELREAFIKTLNLKREDVVFPGEAHLFVALGAAIESENFPSLLLSELSHKLQTSEKITLSGLTMAPLFETEAEYQKFQERHQNQHSLTFQDINTYSGRAFLGIDCGSTTTKIILIGEDAQILFQFYDSNKGNPLEIVGAQLMELLKICERNNISIASSAVTGYGEELIKAAYGINFGYVETIAHYTAARFFDPLVTYIIDIGGQDMKCMKISNGAIDSLLLNEACSSGCGSFIETFAKSLGYSTADFAKIGLLAKAPADLGSRCTVFMNSSVKQAQKDGASVADVAAGIAVSVIKNALYKVLRIKDSSELGAHVVVQGGTFYNDAVLRALEREINHHVIRPVISGLMGAFGAALLARKKVDKAQKTLTVERLQQFTCKQINYHCNLCSNKCLITKSIFNDGASYITGNKCERGAGLVASDLPNTFGGEYQAMLDLPRGSGKNGKIGIPLVLNYLDTYPFWNSFFRQLDFEIVLSATSSKDLYQKGQHTIPSDTACYPAKLVHGHIINLIEQGINDIFYPIIVYNFKEKSHVDNHYNCPVVAYYPELIAGNVDEVKKVNLIAPYIQLMSPNFARTMHQEMKKLLPNIRRAQINSAIKIAYRDYQVFRKKMRKAAEEAMIWAKRHHKHVIVLAGRPYHLDPGINHGIDRLLTTLDAVVVSENQISHLTNSHHVRVLNQWTFHSRLYDAATYVAGNPNIDLVQLVSFGCGIDAITTDETRAILEASGRLYTQIKIDEITNLGAAKIRLRSLMAAIEGRKKEQEEKKEDAQKVR